MFGIGVGNAPVWCQPYRGIFLAYYNDGIFVVQAPLGDEILIISKKITTADMDKFAEYGIMSVPAVEVNDQAAENEKG